MDYEEFLQCDYSEEEDQNCDDQEPLCSEDWQDLNSQDLLNMWMSIQEYIDTFGLRRTLLQGAHFNDFCEFVHSYSIKS
jgi:hypothetical protein